MSDKTKLYEKMNQVMERVGKLQKDGEITDRTGKKMYSYLSEEQTTGTLQKLFVEFKLAMFPVEVEEDFFYIEGAKYEKVYKNPVTKVKVKYKIVDIETGEFEIIQSVGYGADEADKGSNKAMTGAFKYAQRQTFMIASGEDGDHTSSESITERNSSKPKPNKPKTPSEELDDDTKEFERHSKLNGVLVKWQVLSGEKDNAKAKESFNAFLKKKGKSVDTVTFEDLTALEETFAKRLLEIAEEKKKGA